MVSGCSHRRCVLLRGRCIITPHDSPAYQAFAFDPWRPGAAQWHDIAAQIAAVSRGRAWHQRPWIVAPQGAHLNILQTAWRDGATHRRDFFPPEMLSRAAFWERLNQSTSDLSMSRETNSGAIAQAWPVYVALRMLTPPAASSTEAPQTRFLPPGLDTAASMSTLAQELIETALGAAAAFDEPRELSALLDALQHKTAGDAPSMWLSWEAQCVFAVARLLGDAPEGAWARSQQMRAWSVNAAPLVWIDDAPCPAWIRRLLEAHAQCAPVWHWTVEAAPSRHAQLWQDVWPEITLANPSASSEPQLSAAQPAQTSSAPRIEAIGCGTLEAAALCAAQFIAQQLRLQPQRRSARLALVVFDRLLARRTLALLRRAGIAVIDTGGWALSTTLAASAVMHLLDALQSDHIGRYLDWLHSPFVFAELADKPRWLAAIAQHARVLGRSRGVAALLDRCLTDAALLQSPAANLGLKALHALWRAAGSSGAALPWLPVWQHCGVQSALLQDAAGQAVWRAWERVGQAIGHDAAAGEWSLAFRYECEAARFVPAVKADAQVELMSLPQTRGRHFDRLVFLGGSEQQLPGTPTAGVLSEVWRHELGFATRAQREAQMLCDLSALLAQASSATLIWQSREGDEPIALSRWWQRFADHQADVWQENHPDAVLKACRIAFDPAPRAAAHGKLDQLPAVISVAALNRLIECPFKYYLLAEHGLSERRVAISEELGRRVAGNALHAALATFHLTTRSRAESTLPETAAALARAFETALRPALLLNPAYRAHLIEARNWLSHYLNWDPGEGSTVLAIEKPLERELPGLALRVRGRIDRLDRNANRQRLIDYKLSSSSQVRNWALRPTESIQLAVYAWMLDDADVEAGYLVIERDGVRFMPVEQAQAQGARVIQRLVSDLQRALEGEPLRPLGVAGVCARCDFRGVCRKEHAPARGTKDYQHE